jgi:hypothetical protein
MAHLVRSPGKGPAVRRPKPVAAQPPLIRRDAAAAVGGETAAALKEALERGERR